MLIAKAEGLSKEIVGFGDPKEVLENLIGKARHQTQNVHVKEPRYRVAGCVSEVYIRIITTGEKLEIDFYADALTVRGYLALIHELINGEKYKLVKEEFDAAIEALLESTGLQKHMTPMRANTLGNIALYIKEYL